MSARFLFVTTVVTSSPRSTMQAFRCSAAVKTAGADSQHRGSQRRKHLPVVERSGSTLTVTVGAVEHPMVDVHHIQWLYVETAQGGHIRYLHPGEAPRAVLSWATRHRWRSMPTAICMACGRQNSDKTISPSAQIPGKRDPGLHGGDVRCFRAVTGICRNCCTRCR